MSAGRRRLAALRLTALGLGTADAASASDVVRHLLAVQAQDFNAALWALGQRAPGATAASVIAEHEAGGFVRSWPMRGTLHFVPPEDLRWMLSLTGDRQIRSAAARHRQLELEPADFERAADLAVAELSGGRTATRAELLAAFERGGVSPAGQRGPHLLGVLAQRGLLVQSGRERWSLLEEWAPGGRVLDRDEALRELALRYAIGHGPASDRDLAWWAGLPLTDVRAGLASAADRLERTEVDGTVYHHAPGLEPARRAVHLLPGFDEFLLGYADRSAQLDPERFQDVVPGGNGVFHPTIVVDGRVRGLWRRVKAGAKRITIGVRTFEPLPETAHRAIRKSLDRYGAFLGLEVELAEPATG